MSRYMNIAMSGVSVGRLGMFTCRVMLPASSFETAMVVMSGAFGFSPVESVKVVELLALRAALPSAEPGMATSSKAAESSIASIVSPVVRLFMSCSHLLAHTVRRPVR